MAHLIVIVADEYILIHGPKTQIRLSQGNPYEALAQCLMPAICISKTLKTILASLKFKLGRYLKVGQCSTRDSNANLWRFSFARVTLCPAYNFGEVGIETRVRVDLLWATITFGPSFFYNCCLKGMICSSDVSPGGRDNPHNGIPCQCGEMSL